VSDDLLIPLLRGAFRCANMQSLGQKRDQADSGRTSVRRMMTATA
jgi:hypothetical protein